MFYTTFYLLSLLLLLKEVGSARLRECIGHAVYGTWTKSITGTQTFPISKLGGWKHINAFRKSSKTNRHQALKLTP